MDVIALSRKIGYLQNWFDETAERYHSLSEYSLLIEYKATRIVALCDYQRKVIAINPFYLDSIPLDRIGPLRETFLHEVAHALLTPKDGHNPRFRAMCRELGIDGSATCSNIKLADALTKWEGICPKCNRSWRYARKPKFTKVVCPYDGTRFTVENVMGLLVDNS